MNHSNSNPSMSSHRMPRPLESPKVSPVPIAVLAMELDRFLKEEVAVRQEYPWASRFVMGLPLAPWQRGFVWSEEQSRRFITSAWTGFPLGAYMLTQAEVQQGAKIRYLHLSNAVLDGQQRLHALELYLTDQLAVPDAAGRLTLWSELDPPEQRWFKNRVFERSTTPLADEPTLRETYDLLNFGGVPHLESEGAVQA